MGSVMGSVMGSGLPNRGLTLSLSSAALPGQYEQKTMEKHILSHETNHFEFPLSNYLAPSCKKRGS